MMRGAAESFRDTHFPFDGLPFRAARLNYPGGLFMPRVLWASLQDPSGLIVDFFLPFLPRDFRYICWSFVNYSDLEILLVYLFLFILFLVTIYYFSQWIVFLQRYEGI